jgi:beta-N-acetylhexosaminidase
MIVVGFIGQTVTDTLYADLFLRNLGGVILSGANGNLNSPSQIQTLTAQIRTAAQTAPFIATDQEGGKVARLNASNGFANTLSAYTLGTTYHSIDSTRKQSALMADWLRSCGINVDFAPVVDVNVNPSSPAIGALGRSFSASPAAVSAHAKAFADELHAKGIMATTKHFPGHGSAASDSHNGFTDITTTWLSSELIPYQQLFAGNSVDLVMIGHLFNAKIDSVYPASLSHAAIRGLLRDTLGYNGVVITDAMGMGAITKYYGVWDAAERSINAGTDILLYTSSIDSTGASFVRKLIDTLEARVQRGRIAQSRIDEAYDHVMQLKSRYLITGVTGPFAASGTVPRGFGLSNYPNPFNPGTVIRFQVSGVSDVDLRVYDVLGREVAVLVHEERSPGEYRVTWSPNLASGVYLCRLEAKAMDGSGAVSVETRKMILLK